MRLPRAPLALPLTLGLLILGIMLGLALLNPFNAARDEEAGDGLTESMTDHSIMVDDFEQQVRTSSPSAHRELTPDSTRRAVSPTPLPDGVDMRELKLPSFPSVEGVTHLQSGQFPEQIELQLQKSDGPGPKDVLAMSSELKTGQRTPLGDHMELILRSEIAAEPESAGLIHSVTCAAKLCELQILETFQPGQKPPVNDVVKARLDMVDRIVAANPAFTTSYRPRRGMTIRTEQGYFQVWYWSERK